MSWNLSTLDPSEDWDLWDGVEELTFCPYQSHIDDHPPSNWYTVKGLCREILHQQISLPNGDIVAVDLVIHLKRHMTPGDFGVKSIPRRYDRLIREEWINSTKTTNQIYVVQNVRFSTFGTRFRIDCSKQQTT